MKNHRRFIVVAFQLSLFVFVYLTSFLLRFDFAVQGQARVLFFRTLPAVIATKLPVFFYFGLFSGWWRYAGIADVRDITKAAFSSSVVIWAIMMLVLRPVGFPRSVILIDMSLTILLVGGARFSVRLYREQIEARRPEKKTLIAGAGAAGTELVRQLKRNPDLDYQVVGFVDDDVTKRGIKVQGSKVLGTTEDIVDVVQKRGVECVIIAIPSARGKVVERIVEKCRSAKVEFKILQSIERHINGHSLTKMRSVQIEDVLGRDPVHLDLAKIQEQLRHRTVLITGAGGSIGSELCRQVASFHPRKLVLFERSESDLFRISDELSFEFPKVAHVPVIGDILDVTALRDTFALHRPDSVFHAAAYKHVPMMEANCFQAISNNVFGTYNVALVARQFEVGDFVLISSDKAVKPANVMGVTKRISEIIILSLQNHGTRYVAVRFGNVLGSNGSVVPLFESQIARGGPVLVTHPDATRYFMTIPEAVQLVLQSSSMGRGGEIFVLKMGDPVKIVDLATNMIRLSGYEPERDIKIIYTGLRPGEKLHEELYFEQEGMGDTYHDKVCVLNCKPPADFAQVSTWLSDLAGLIEMKNIDGAVAKLREIVPEYSPSDDLMATCGLHRHDLVSRYISRMQVLVREAA